MLVTAPELYCALRHHQRRLANRYALSVLSRLLDLNDMLLYRRV